MNLARVLEQESALLPAARQAEIYPRLHPRLFVRRHEEHDGTVYISVIPGGRPPMYFRMNPAQWQIANLFNGERSYAEVAQLGAELLHCPLTEPEVRSFADALEKDGYWYHTPQEESALLCHELMQQRQRKVQGKPEHGELFQIVLYSFDPDKYLDWVIRHFRWLYSRWFTVWSLFMVAVMFAILGSHWGQVWSDSVEFYRLTGRGAWHVVEFFAIFLALGAVHEASHGLTCKYFGGEVHRIGVMLVYLCPAIFCDISHVYAHGGRWERITSVFAGVWSEVVMCSYASVIWWATPAGTTLHTMAYYVILSGGIFCVVINWNPLARMDGYMIVSEYYRIHDLKGTATYFLVSWIRKNIFRLPATVPSYSPMRAISYAVYALLAGAYSYFMLLFFARIVYHVLYYYSPRWALLPATALGLFIFKGRIRKLVKFMKELYLDKIPLLRAHARLVGGVAVALLILGFLPIRREHLEEKFVLEPAQRAVLRTEVPARVTRVFGDEGQRVNAGAVIAELSDPSVDSRSARAAANYKMAASQAINSQLRYADFATSEEQRKRFALEYQVAKDQQRRLTVRTPIAGLILTPRVHELEGTYLGAGSEIAQVADTSSMRARIFVPEPEVRKLQFIHHTVLRTQSSWRSVAGEVISISPASQVPDAALVAKAEYSGIDVTQYYLLTVAIENPGGAFRDGMTGTAKVFGRRRGAISLLLQPVVDAVARRLW